MKVIVRSNEDDPFIVGRIIRHERIHNTDIPVVESESGETYFCLGIVVAWDEALAARLQAMTPKDQWNHLSKHYKRK